MARVELIESGGGGVASLDFSSVKPGLHLIVWFVKNVQKYPKTKDSKVSTQQNIQSGVNLTMNLKDNMFLKCKILFKFKAVFSHVKKDFQSAQKI